MLVEIFSTVPRNIRKLLLGRGEKRAAVGLKGGGRAEAEHFRGAGAYGNGIRLQQKLGFRLSEEACAGMVAIVCAPKLGRVFIDYLDLFGCFAPLIELVCAPIVAPV